MTDERDLDDPALTAAWQAQSAESPPAALDEAILAAAHRAVKSAPERISPGGEATRPWRWWAPLAAAATIGAIAIGVLQMMPQEHDATTAVVSDMPANAPVSVPPLAPGALEDRKTEAARDNASAAKPSRGASTFAAPARERADASGKVAQPTQQRAEPAAHVAPRPVPQSPPESSRAVEMESTPAPALSKRALGDAASAAASAPSPSPAPSPLPSPRTPDEWIARIRAFMVAGDMVEASRALTSFRAAHRDADARLPADLRPWAATVPR